MTAIVAAAPLSRPLANPPVPKVEAANAAHAGSEEARESADRAAAYLAAEMRRERVRAVLLMVLPPVLGIALFIGIWALVSLSSPQLPSPVRTWASAVQLFSDPFYRKG